jgi:hypothetical protein
VRAIPRASGFVQAALESGAGVAPEAGVAAAGAAVA